MSSSSKSRKHQSQQVAADSRTPSSIIATRSVLAAQMAVALRQEAKSILKQERDKSGGVAPYYSQLLTTMISRSSDEVGKCALSSLATLEYLNLAASSRHREQITRTASFLSKSAGYHVLSCKMLYEALRSSLDENSGTTSSTAKMYDNEEETRRDLSSVEGEAEL